MHTSDRGIGSVALADLDLVRFFVHHPLSMVPIEWLAARVGQPSEVIHIGLGRLADARVIEGRQDSAAEVTMYRLVPGRAVERLLTCSRLASDPARGRRARRAFNHHALRRQTREARSSDRALRDQATELCYQADTALDRSIELICAIEDRRVQWRGRPSVGI